MFGDQQASTPEFSMMDARVDTSLPSEMVSNSGILSASLDATAGHRSGFAGRLWMGRGRFRSRHHCSAPKCNGVDPSPELFLATILVKQAHAPDRGKQAGAFVSIAVTQRNHRHQEELTEVGNMGLCASIGGQSGDIVRGRLKEVPAGEEDAYL